MGSLFDFIFSNPLFLIIIIGILAKLFQSKPKTASENGENKKPSVRTILEEAFNEETIEKAKRTVEDSIKSVTNDPERTKKSRKNENEVKQNYTGTIGGTHQAQLERLKKQYQASSDDNTIEQYSPFNRMKNNQVVHSQSEISIGELNVKLTQKKLIESVIMAEVLGLPRAMNRYENIAMKRKIIQ